MKTAKISARPRTFQELIFALQRYWSLQGCVILQPYDMEVGAGTFHTATFLRSIGPEPWRAAYVQPSRRPTDGRYGNNPFRLQHYYQFQVLIKPSPLDMIDLYLGSLVALGFDPLVHDIRFVEDNWESPTLGAWGLGWEVWLNGMEISQFTYFQQVGGLDCRPVSGEITYGLERLAMYLQDVESLFDIVWTDGPQGRVSYRDVFHQNEAEQSTYNFEHADPEMLFRHFDDHERACNALLAARLALPAYEQVLKASHVFNLLDARRAISVTERQRFILRVRTLARCVAQAYLVSREALGFPLLGPRAGGRMNATAPERRDFLFEIGTEELPPKALPELEQALREGLDAQLTAANLRHGAVVSFATPRRLAVRVRHLAARQPEQTVRRRGPPLRAAFDAAGQPTRAAQAFAASCAVDLAQLGRERDEQGNEYLWYAGTRPGALAVSLLPGIVAGVLDALPIPRRMRWGAGDAQFVRPVHWLVMLYGAELVPATVLGIAAGRSTRGHRFHAPRELPLRAPASYEKTLLTRGRVVADFATRRERVRAQVTSAAEQLGGRAIIEAPLLEEVTALVEWPVAIAGQFEARFLDLPREVLLAALQDHQRYFAVESASAELLPWFIAVSNIESREPAVVRAGNERVVRPRLADAAFFWEQDRRAPLAAQVASLARVTFQAQLGSIADKAQRLGALAASLAAACGASPARVARAALLCKCDLLSSMVGEFPELQGVMGAYHAQADGEDPETATAIREHYLPRSAGDQLPSTPTGTALALADRLDTLAGIFRDRTKTHRHARSVRPAPCRHRRAAHQPRALARFRPARAA